MTRQYKIKNVERVSDSVLRVTIGDTIHFVPDDMANSYRASVDDWINDGNTIKDAPKEPEPDQSDSILLQAMLSKFADDVKKDPKADLELKKSADKVLNRRKSP